MPMTSSDHRATARQCYEAYVTGDPEILETTLAGDFRFWSPTDPGGIDRSAYFERCWPNHENSKSFDFKRLEQIGDEVFVTYEAERNDGTRFRNTEVMSFAGEKLRTVEVYFGWELEPN